MHTSQRLSLIRWLLVGALLVCAFCAARGALMVYFMTSIGDISVFQPPSAEEVSRQAAPFQGNTRETDGMFRVVRDQHRHLDLMFSRLETSNELNWSLAVVETGIFSLLTCILLTCLALLVSNRKHGQAADSKPSPRSNEP